MKGCEKLRTPCSVILSRRSAAKDLQMRCRWLVLRNLRSFAVYAAQDDGVGESAHARARLLDGDERLVRPAGECFEVEAYVPDQCRRSGAARQRFVDIREREPRVLHHAFRFEPDDRFCVVTLRAV